MATFDTNLTYGPFDLNLDPTSLRQRFEEDTGNDFETAGKKLME